MSAPKAEPKVYFANERTFLNWIHTSVIISSTGLALMNLSPNSGGASRASIIAGALMIPVAILFMIMALYVFVQRDKMIREGGDGFYNKNAPTIITVVFFASLVVNYVLWFVEHGTDIENWHNEH